VDTIDAAAVIAEGRAEREEQLDDVIHHRD